MKFLGGMLHIAFSVAVGVGIGRGIIDLANQRNRSYVESHDCLFEATERNRMTVEWGWVIHLPDMSYYQCSDPAVVVTVDGRPAEVRR